MAVKYFVNSYYWNGAWYFGTEVNSYNGSLWRIQNAAWGTNLFSGASFYFRTKGYTSGGTITINVGTDANNSSLNGSTYSMPATNAGYYFGVPYTAAQINILKNGGYLFFRTNFSVLFDGPAGSTPCYSLLDSFNQDIHVRAGGAWRFGTAHVRVSGTWRTSYLTYIRVAGTWRTRGAG